jgi:hypothetical protein
MDIEHRERIGAWGAVVWPEEAERRFRAGDDIRAHPPGRQIFLEDMAVGLVVIDRYDG